jgi:16S rRNA (guanine966-N2)-methyltransferase
MRIVGGRFRGKKLLAPTHEGTRPTSDRTRETIFNILLHNPAFGPHVLINKNVLDVFAGTGALGLEAYSRGAQSVTFIENDSRSKEVLKSNLINLKLLSTAILSINALSLGNSTTSYDLIFLDPPYHKGMVLPTLQALHKGGWFKVQAVIVIEVAKEEILELPAFLSLVTERVSGAARILFCQLT